MKVDREKFESVISQLIATPPLRVIDAAGCIRFQVGGLTLWYRVR
jgi:hypothetical protein